MDELRWSWLPVERILLDNIFIVVGVRTEPENIATPLGSDRVSFWPWRKGPAEVTPAVQRRMSRNVYPTKRGYIIRSKFSTIVGPCTCL